MPDDPVLVPPEVAPGLKDLEARGYLDPGERPAAIDAAADRGLDATVKWLEQVGEGVYDRAARGEFRAADKA